MVGCQSWERTVLGNLELELGSLSKTSSAVFGFFPRLLVSEKSVGGSKDETVDR